MHGLKGFARLLLPHPERKPALPKSDDIQAHYAGAKLAARIFKSLDETGISRHDATPEALAPFDEFHVGGITATMRVADRLSLDPTHHLLDVGCGAGGPARVVAARTGCQVTGIDLTHDFIEAGDELSRFCGLEHQVTLHQGSALDMSYESASFDRAMMLHVGMNIDDKAGLLREVFRVLKPGGIFAAYDMMRTGDAPINFPMPWASTAAVSAVDTPQTYIEAAMAAGFTLADHIDETAAAMGFFQKVLETRSEQASDKPDRFRNLAKEVTSGNLAPTELYFAKVNKHGSH